MYEMFLLENKVIALDLLSIHLEKPGFVHLHQEIYSTRGYTDRKQENTSKDIYCAKISPGQKSRLL